MGNHAGPPPGPFQMPMYHRFVPHKIRPWIYLIFAICFQFSGGMYMGALNEIIGGKSLMREDVLMCLYSNLAGMAIYFPLLFRMKFRFTNKTLLLASALTIAACNIVIPHIDTLPILWTVCFISGCAKIQGTFECISNIQLWITPKRDFAIFFPVLHTVILCSIQASDLITTWLVHHYHWHAMHWLVTGLMFMVMLAVTLLTKHCRIVPKMPLYGIDWLGALLWAMLGLELVFIFNYGDFYDWFHSPVIRAIFGAALITGGVATHRMIHIRHPFLEPGMWKTKHLVPILLLMAVVESMLISEHVLEKIYYAAMQYSEYTIASTLNWCTIIGIVSGALFSLFWLKRLQYSYYKLISIGLAAMAGYLAYFYFFMSPEDNIELFYLPLIMRGFSSCVLSSIFMLSVKQLVPFLQFFQALAVFNIIHMFLGGSIGGALYTTGMNYYMTDNITRYSSYVDSVAVNPATFNFPEFIDAFLSNMQIASLKQLYGWVLYACIFTFLAFLLYDRPYVRRALRRIPRWKEVGQKLKSAIRH
ncbi:MAG: hypothetical protein IJ328_03790 [Muribaculaceae bacterium]|nr:hypothetical protein [Muribaculaceae bacterium]